MGVKFNVYLYWDYYWKLRFRNVPQLRLRERLQRLYVEGWSPVSIFVERAEVTP